MQIERTIETSDCLQNCSFTEWESTDSFPYKIGDFNDASNISMCSAFCTIVSKHSPSGVDFSECIYFMRVLLVGR